MQRFVLMLVAVAASACVYTGVAAAANTSTSRRHWRPRRFGNSRTLPNYNSVYIAHNGIQVSFGAAATIDTSTIRDHEYTAKNRRTPNAGRGGVDRSASPFLLRG